MNKKVLLIIVPFVFLGIIAVAYLSQPKPEKVTINPQATFVPPTNSKISLEDGKSDETVVDNFYTESTYTYPTGNAVLEENENYQIVYIADQKLFQISIFSEDEQGTEARAGQAFLEKLGVNQQQACRMNVEVLIYSGLNFSSPSKKTGLVYCQ